MTEAIWARLRETRPLVHCITNYVTANDCANLLLACGALPMMADDPEEAEEATALSRGLCLNLGTLHSRTIPAMMTSAGTARARGIPMVLDPVGAGAMTRRTETALALIREGFPRVIRGNLSEIKALALGTASSRGVDAAPEDAVTEDSAALARAFAGKTGAVIFISGAMDILSDGERVYIVRNGDAGMSRITGTGCQLSALTAALCAAAPDHPLEAAVTAACAMGLAGERAFSRLSPAEGSATARTHIIDEIYHMTPERLKEGARYELR